MKKPDWSEWNWIPRVKAWQAVALSIDLDPNNLREDVHTQLIGFGSFFKQGSFPSRAIEQEFEKRLRILEANLTNSGTFRDVVVNYGETRISIVALAEFSAWAKSLGWEIPKELAKKSARSDESEAVLLQHEDAQRKIAVGFPPTSPAKLGGYQSPHNASGQKPETTRLCKLARDAGEKYKVSQTKKTGKCPSVEAIAKFVEAEFKDKDIRGAHGDYLSAATIKRDALKGITGRKRGENLKGR